MKNEINGRILTTYFCMEGILSKLSSNLEESFIKLCDIYGLDDKKEALSLFNASKEGLVSDIESSKNGLRIEKQIRKSEGLGIRLNVSELDMWILSTKNEALRRLERANLLFDYESDEVALMRTIEHEARNGDLTASLILGFLFANGIGVVLDLKLARSYFEIGFKWGDLDSTLMLLHYDTNNSEKYLGFVKVYCDKSIHSALFTAISKKYPLLDKAPLSAEARLTSLYLSSTKDDAAKRYNNQIARIIFSDRLTIADKEKLLLSNSKDRIACANELPLEVLDRAVELNYKGFVDMPLKRDDEAEKIWMKLVRFDADGQKAFKPILLVCKDRFVSDMYKEAIASVLQCDCIKEINANSVSTNNLEYGCNNIMLRSVADMKNERTALVFDNVQSISLDTLDRFSKQISVNGRSAFQLNDIGLSFDFSDTVIILTATQNPHNSIVNACATIHCKEITDAEKMTVVETLLKRRKLNSLTEEMKNELCTMSVQKIAYLIKELYVLSHSRFLKGEGKELTQEDFNRCLEGAKGLNAEKYGFNRTSKTQ